VEEGCFAGFADMVMDYEDDGNDGLAEDVG